MVLPGSGRHRLSGEGFGGIAGKDLWAALVLSEGRRHISRRLILTILDPLEKSLRLVEESS